MSNSDKFIFNGYKEQLERGVVEFFYVLVHNGKTHNFTEKLSVPQVTQAVPPEVVKAALDALHLALGISYWKTYCPETIEMANIQLSQEQAAFWDTVYTKGLGEFFYKNNIDFHNLVHFPFVENVVRHPVTLERKNRALVGIGGGKDSIVSAKLLQETNIPITGFTLGTHPIQEAIIEKLGIESVAIKRTLDPQLLALNKEKDTFNGHVPISMIYHFVGLLAAILYDYRYVVFSNEKSSNYGNVSYLGEEINHQWSKSLEFETLFSDYISSSIVKGIEVFSLLRSLHEIKIAELFSHYEEFFPLFSSCNRNFRITETTNKKWCGECPKCAFAFIVLAPFINKEKLHAIFGQNLLQKEELLPTYRELLGIKDFKPFDCVGTPEETRLAFRMAEERGEHNDTAAMKMFEEEVKDLSQDTSNLLLYDKSAVLKRFN